MEEDIVYEEDFEDDWEKDESESCPEEERHETNKEALKETNQTTHQQRMESNQLLTEVQRVLAFSPEKPMKTEELSQHAQQEPREEVPEEQEHKEILPEIVENTLSQSLELAEHGQPAQGTVADKKKHPPSLLFGAALEQSLPGPKAAPKAPFLMGDSATPHRSVQPSPKSSRSPVSPASTASSSSIDPLFGQSSEHPACFDFWCPISLRCHAFFEMLVCASVVFFFKNFCKGQSNTTSLLSMRVFHEYIHGKYVDMFICLRYMSMYNIIPIYTSTYKFYHET
jgi:hypothetical protein